MIKIICTEHEFESLKSEWKDLFSRLNYVTPFQSFDFNYNLWTIFEKDASLYIVCVYRQSDKKLIAIFPCIKKRSGVLQFINHIYADYCMPIIDYEACKDYYIYREFADYIKSDDSVAGFMFDNLREDCYLIGIMGYLFRGTQTRISNKWTSFLLNYKDSGYKDFVNSLSQLSSKDKYKIKNIIKKSPISELRLFNIKDSIYPKEIVDEIIKHMIKSGLRTNAYFTYDFRLFLERLYNAGLLTIACTFDGNKPLAANIYLIKDNEYIDWLAIYIDRRHNTTNLLQMMELIYNNSGGTFNFGRGLYDYKVSNFKPEIHNLYRIEYSKSRISQIRILFSICKFHLKEYVKPIFR